MKEDGRHKPRAAQEFNYIRGNNRDRGRRAFPFAPRSGEKVARSAG
jgi:hypothetical protein